MKVCRSAGMRVRGSAVSRRSEGSRSAGLQSRRSSVL